MLLLIMKEIRSNLYPWICQYTSKLLLIFFCSFTDPSCCFSACFFCSSFSACSCSNWICMGSLSCSSPRRSSASSLQIFIFNLMCFSRSLISSSCRSCSAHRDASTLARAASLPWRLLSIFTAVSCFSAISARHSSST